MTISRIWRSQRKIVMVAVVSAILLAAVGTELILQRRNASVLKTPFRIGFYNSGVEHFLGPNGKPEGNAVDLLNEAARRAGIELDWVYSPEGTDAALESDQVDLWPVVGNLPERKGRFYISAPFNMTEFGLVSLQSNPVIRGGATPDVTLAVIPGAIEEKLSTKLFPNGKLLDAANTSEQLADVCINKAQAAIITENFNASVWPPDCKNVPLRMADTPDATVKFGVGASYRSPGAVQAADMLRYELGKMAEDGTLVGTEFRWHDGSLPQTRALFYELAGERSEHLLEGASIVLVASLFVLGWFVTARKRAALALVQERQLLRTLIDNMPDRIYVKDAKSRWVVANRTLADMFGAKGPDELLGKTDFDYFPEDIATAFFSDEQAIIESGSLIVNQEERRVDADGKMTWTSTTKVPWRDALGNVIGTMGIGHDITERKNAEENFYKAFNASPEPITITTVAEGRYLDVNESFLRTSGFGREEVIGRTSIDLKIWGSLEDRARLLKRLEEHGSVRDMEVPFRTKSGEQRVWMHSVNRIEYDGKQCLISSQKDVTERKLLEKQLRQSQKMEAVGRLSGGIAHDFNNLLGVIIGYSEVLEESPSADEKVRKSAGQIKAAGKRAASLTRQLLAFSRQQVLEPKVLDLNQIVGETEKMLRRLIGEDIELTTRLTPDLGQTKADQGQIEQVILNLAVNARDAMPDGGKLLIETANVELDAEYAFHHPPTVPGRYLSLIVTDSGTGMDAETQAHIFEPFFTTKEVGKGTGLGLATVYGVVKQSGGWVWVYSEVGIGTTFKVYLPRVDQPVERAAPSQVRAHFGRGTETILLVEDEILLRNLTRTLLEQSGYTVLEAGSGCEALEIATNHTGSIQLLLTDMVMPGMSGPEVSEKLTPIHPESKTIYMSGYTSFAGRWSLSPDAALLQKPFTRIGLLEKVRDVLDVPVPTRVS